MPRKRRNDDRVEAAGGAPAPLVVLGQGQYAREYPRPNGDRPRLFLNAALLQKRAGAVLSRAGLFGWSLQHQGAQTAARELCSLGAAVDELRQAMDEIAGQLDEHANGGGS